MSFVERYLHLFVKGRVSIHESLITVRKTKTNMTVNDLYYIFWKIFKFIWLNDFCMTI